jgi:hypothetical protein
MMKTKAKLNAYEEFAQAYFAPGEAQPVLKLADKARKDVKSGIAALELLLKKNMKLIGPKNDKWHGCTLPLDKVLDTLLPWYNGVAVHREAVDYVLDQFKLSGTRPQHILDKMLIKNGFGIIELRAHTNEVEWARTLGAENGATNSEALMRHLKGRARKEPVEELKRIEVKAKNPPPFVKGPSIPAGPVPRVKVKATNVPQAIDYDDDDEPFAEGPVVYGKGDGLTREERRNMIQAKVNSIRHHVTGDGVRVRIQNIELPVEEL